MLHQPVRVVQLANPTHDACKEEAEALQDDHCQEHFLPNLQLGKYALPAGACHPEAAHVGAMLAQAQVSTGGVLQPQENALDCFKRVPSNW